MLDPCIEPSVVEVSGVAPTQPSYILQQYSAEEPFYFTHEPFTVTSPFDITLCGEMTITPIFNGFIPNESSTPVAYDVSMSQFSIFSEDPSLAGEQTITIYGQYGDN